MTVTCDHDHEVVALDAMTNSSIPLAARVSNRAIAVPHRAIRLYQWLFAARVSPCRYEPSCSNYALESLETHGLMRGTWLAVRRLGRCHPWGGHGWDPVPSRKAA
jgi:hypothetical protein